MYVCMYVYTYACSTILAKQVLTCDEEANFSRVINVQDILGNQESFLLLVEEKKKMQETWEEN